MMLPNFTEKQWWISIVFLASIAVPMLIAWGGDVATRIAGVIAAGLAVAGAGRAIQVKRQKAKEEDDAPFDTRRR